MSIREQIGPSRRRLECPLRGSRGGWHHVHVIPVLLGDGARLLDNLAGAAVKRLECTRAIAAAGVTHVSYAVLR